MSNQIETIIKQNKVVWNETLNRADSFSIPDSKNRAQVFDSAKLPELFLTKQPTAKIVKVLNTDILTVAEICSQKQLNPMVINCGSNNDPLKQVEMGAIGTEWNLMRRSNLHRLIETDIQYPLRDGKILYIPEITVFKSDEYKLLKNPFKISVLTIPPVRQPSLVSSVEKGHNIEIYSNQMELDSMKKYIDSMFSVALYKGHNCLILDDFGCQKNFNNPIHVIIKWLNESIKKYPIKYVFFAVDYPPLEKINLKKNALYSNYKLFDELITRY